MAAPDLYLILDGVTGAADAVERLRAAGLYAFVEESSWQLVSVDETRIVSALHNRYVTPWICTPTPTPEPPETPIP